MSWRGAGDVFVRRCRDVQRNWSVDRRIWINPLLEALGLDWSKLPAPEGRV
jgi:hypothetical protein